MGNTGGGGGGWGGQKGSKGQNSTVLEHGHFAYDIKGDHECSNILVNIMSTDLPPPTPRVKGSKFNFSEHVHVVH